MTFQITAKHAGLGTVLFTMEAADRKAAFSKFKSVVFNHKQWIVSSNDEIASGKESLDVQQRGRWADAEMPA